MGGYTHGMMTVRVPQEIAQTIDRIARELNVETKELVLSCVAGLVDRDFAEIWADDLPERKK